jgi:hypothetical protein
VGKQRRGLLAPADDSTPDIQWTATDRTGNPLAELHIRYEGDGEFSIRAGYHEGPELILRQRTFKLHSDENVNSIGLLAKAIMSLGD